MEDTLGKVKRGARNPIRLVVVTIRGRRPDPDLNLHLLIQRCFRRVPARPTLSENCAHLQAFC